MNGGRDDGRLHLDNMKSEAGSGLATPAYIYKIMQCAIYEELANTVGYDAAEKHMRRAGFRAGKAFAKYELDLSLDFTTFIKQLQKKLQDIEIGISKIEKFELEKTEVVLILNEDMDFSELFLPGDTMYTYDEGFIAGILKSYFIKEPVEPNVDCWVTMGRGLHRSWKKLFI